VAGISNPYISQIERGLKKPSAEILQSLAKALRISAESLYIRAGILDERTGPGEVPVFDVTDAILADPKLNDRQRAVLLDVYESFVGPAAGKAPKAQTASKPTATAKPDRAPGAEHKPGPARKSGPARKKTPEQKTPEQKKTEQSSIQQQSSNQEKKS
jgi:transcriptional regulator with XRE-family HTH domain